MWLAGAGGVCTVTEIDVVLDRVCESEMVMPSVFTPAVVSGVTCASNVNVLPLPLNAWVGEPPMGERLPVTVMPVLVGFVPGTTVTLSVVVSPAESEAGVAMPMPVGGVDVSSLTIVPVPLLFATITPVVTFVTLTKKVSLGSMLLSPLTDTGKVKEVPPCGMVTLAEL